LSVLTVGDTDIGMKRKSNQDSICLYPEMLFFAVADGMGGHKGGDIASQNTVKLLPDFLKQLQDQDPSIALEEAIKRVNGSLLEIAAEKEELKGMGTTISCIYYQGNQLLIGNVGDSRTYLIHKMKLFQLSRDHSLVQEKINMGIYSRDMAKNDNQKNVLVRTVGYDENIEVDIYNYKISKNDLFLVCSDGLHGKVSDHDILAIVNQHIPDPATATTESAKEAVKALIQAANDNGGQDNISVIISIAQG
jgi:serine/threonine protein phosphatase PrpC